MIHKKRMLAVLATVLVGLALAALTMVQAGNTWVIQFGVPEKSGTHTTTIIFEYADPDTTQILTKPITVTTSVNPAMSANEKKAAVQAKINGALADPANAVGGAPLGETSGSGNVVTITPSSSNGAKIKEVKTKDGKSGEKDRVVPPSETAIAEVAPLGEITGEVAGGGTPHFTVATNRGDVAVQLVPGMRKYALLRALRSGLEAQGAQAWIDQERLVLFVLLTDDEEGVTTIGAGTTDEGLVASTHVMAN